jgi:hypothetical protein
MNETDSSEYRVMIKPGGEIHTTVAADGTEMRHQLLMAIGISTLLGGSLVHIDSWLPGLILKVHALRSIEHGDQVSIEHAWPGMYARLRAWIESPVDADALNLSFDGAHCLLIPDVFTWHVEPVVFTLKCVAALDGWLHQAT